MESKEMNQEQQDEAEFIELLRRMTPEELKRLKEIALEYKKRSEDNV